MFKNPDFDEIQTLESERVNNPDDKPVSPEEEAELLRIVNTHDRIERSRAFNKSMTSNGATDKDVDSYYLASSRLMLKNRPYSSRSLYDSDLLAAPSTKRTYNDYATMTSMYSAPNDRTYTRTTPPIAPTSTEEYYGRTATGYEPRSNNYPYKSTPSFTPSGYQNVYGRGARPAPSTNRSIGDARDQMISMGFSDEDGWLTQLLTLKQGNIEQVIDILTPVKHRKS